MHEMQNSNIFSRLPGVHPIVYYRVDTGICHREPEEEKVDVTDVLVLGDAGHVVHEDEVHVVGRPTHHEDGDHHRAHVHYLQIVQFKIYRRFYSSLTSHPLFVLPTLVDGNLWHHHQLQNGLLTLLEVVAHLGEAERHAQGGEEVGHEEERKVVHVIISR